MSDKQQAKPIKNHIRHLYSFAYALIPDELQARQLVIDSYGANLVDLKMEDYTADKVLGLKSIFDLASKRHQQLETSLEQGSGFWSLDFLTRACLYLHFRENLESSLIGLITNIDHSQLVAIVNRGKKDFLKLKGLSAGSDFNFL